MQKEDINVERKSREKKSSLSLYTEEEIGSVSTTTSFAKSASADTGAVNIFEVSSTSEDTYQLPSTSSKSIFMDLYEEDIVDSGSEKVTDVKTSTSVAGNAVDGKKPKPGLLLLGEYADSGNDTEEETFHSFRAKHEKLKQTVKSTSNKQSSNEALKDQNESTSKESIETGITDALSDVPPPVDKVSAPAVENKDNNIDVDVHALLEDSLETAKLERSMSKEEGQISAESDSSDSERSSESRRDSKKQKDVKKDKSKKKDKKKKKKKRRKQKHAGETKDLDITEGEDKKERKQTRSRSKETSEKRKSLKQSRSRSRDKASGCRRRRSRSRSQDKGKQSRRHNERSRRSRSRSNSRRCSTKNRSKDLKSRSRTPKRSASPSNRRKEREDKHSSTSRSRKDSPPSRKRKVTRSRSPRRYRGASSERRKSRSPRRRSHSPGKRRKVTPERSPNKRSSSKKTRSPDRRERRESRSPPRKSSHRTSSASDSIDSGHFTNIPLSKTSKLDEPVLDNKEPVEISSPVVEKPNAEKQKESSIPTKSADMEKQYSPSFSPAKSWEDEFDFVFTERMSPRQGTEKSMEDVLFGSEAKTPEFKRPTPGESIKSTTKEPQHAEKKEETKAEKLTGNATTTSKENSMPQEKENQDRSSNLQSTFVASKPMIKADERNISNAKDLKSDTSASKPSKTDVGDKTELVKSTADNNDVTQMTVKSDKSAFVQSKLETIPFLGETPSVPAPAGGGGLHSDPPASQLGISGPPLTGTGLLTTSSLHGKTWRDLSEVGLLPTPGSLQKLNSSKRASDKGIKDDLEQYVLRNEEGRKNFNASPMDMEMSSPEGDIIDRMNEEFWKQQQQQHQGVVNKAETKEGNSREAFVESMANEQYSLEEPYEPESDLIIGEEFEEDLNSITDPKERRRREKQQLKEKTKVQELIDKLHRQARVEEEVKHVLKAYYKHRDIDKEEYKSILRRAVPQVTNSSSAIDPERIRSLVKKYVAKIKGQRGNSY